MVIWELINPSDAYTMQGDDFEAACVANCILGCGKTALRAFKERSRAEELDCPLFMFGGHEEWFQDKFGRTFEQSLEAKGEETAKILDTILIGDISDREVFDRTDFSWEEWQDRKRSSLMDYGRQAKSISELIRKKLKAA